MHELRALVEEGRVVLISFDDKVGPAAGPSRSVEIRHDAADKEAGEKHATAIGLTDRAVAADCVLILQSLTEFFHGITRKGQRTPADARGFVDDWRAVFSVFAADEGCLADAMGAVGEHGLPFWGAMIWAVQRRYARPGVKRDQAFRLHTARLLGNVPTLVLHGGGNTSLKTVMADVLGERLTCSSSRARATTWRGAIPPICRPSGSRLCGGRRRGGGSLRLLAPDLPALIGASLFGEERVAWTWIDAAVIFGATLTVVRTKARQTRSR